MPLAKAKLCFFLKQSLIFWVCHFKCCWAATASRLVSLTLAAVTAYEKRCQTQASLSLHHSHFIEHVHPITWLFYNLRLPVVDMGIMWHQTQVNTMLESVMIAFWALLHSLGTPFPNLNRLHIFWSFSKAEYYQCVITTYQCININLKTRLK